MGDHRKLDRSDKQLWQPHRMSSTPWISGRPTVSLSDAIPDPVLYTERACCSLRISRQRRSGGWGCRRLISICSRVYGWVQGHACMEMVIFHVSYLATKKDALRILHELANCGFGRLLIIEGLPSVCLGIFGWFFLANSPETAWYLSSSQRHQILLRKERDEQQASRASAQVLHRSDIFAAFKDWKIWAFSIDNFGADIQLFSYAIFLPTIVKAINPQWSALYVQVLTIPCYAMSTIMYFIVAFISDAFQHRAVFGILGATASIIGHIMLITGRGVAVPYIGCFVIASGLFVISGIAVIWMPSNFPRYGKRSTAIGMMFTMGNSGGIAAPYVS